MPKHKRSRSRERRRDSERYRDSKRDVHKERDRDSRRDRDERKISRRHSRDSKRDERHSRNDSERSKKSRRDRSKEVTIISLDILQRHKEPSEEDKILALRREKLEKFKKEKLSKLTNNNSPNSNGTDSDDKNGNNSQITDSPTSEIIEKKKRNFMEIKEENPKSKPFKFICLGKDSNFNSKLKNSVSLNVDKKVTKKILFGESIEELKPIKKFTPFDKDIKLNEENNIDASNGVEMEDEVDPLDLFMQEVHHEVKKINEKDKNRDMAELEKKDKNKVDKFEEEEQVVEEKPTTMTAEQILAYLYHYFFNCFSMAAKKLRKKELPSVDHTKMDYIKIRKNFWVPPLEHQTLNEEQIRDLRLELDNTKVSGKNCPIPMQKWSQCGMPSVILEILKRREFEAPSAIQAQSIPAILSGRDVIGIAKTGSGKTLAFLLPLFRHVKDQPPLDNQKIGGHFISGETGPIALIMTPTRELALQTSSEIKFFSGAMGIRTLCAFGGSNIMSQISEIKKGIEVMVCTPGRLIDLMASNGGRLLNLNRVSYLVLDEADRMFDMGFEPQVMKIIESVRPDKQTLLFSATFPKLMDALARKILLNPIEIIVGSRSAVCNDVIQIVEVWDDKSKFYRLLKILGIYFNSGIDDNNTEVLMEVNKDDKMISKALKIKPLEKELFAGWALEKVSNKDRRALIFVEKQDSADNLLRELIKHRYPCLSLHGGKDQMDRADTISDFKQGNISILIATSIAARGLDVPRLGLVVNYDPPNHLEDYVHRVGRTGRAGNIGVAVTLVSPDEAKFVPDLCRALKISKAEIPSQLKALADEFSLRVKLGLAHFSGSGYGGKGLEKLKSLRDTVKQIQSQSYDTPDDVDKVSMTKNEDDDIVLPSALKNAKPASIEAFKAAQRAAKNATTLKDQDVEVFVDGPNAEIEINDFPANARWKITSGDTLKSIKDIFGAHVSVKGVYIKPGTKAPDNQRKSYLLIQAPDDTVLNNAKNRILELLKSVTLEEVNNELSTSSNRYKVV